MDEGRGKTHRYRAARASSDRAFALVDEAKFCRLRGEIGDAAASRTT